MNIIAQLIVHNFTDVAKADHSFWYDFLKDYMLPLVLGFAAACVAYYIFVAETKRDRQKEIDAKALERNDKLIFFSASVESALKTAIQQEGYLKEYLREIRADDVSFHLLKFVPLNNFQRIVEVLDLETYLLAYVNKYDVDRTASVKAYKNILANIDYLYHNFKLVFEQVQRAQQHDNERKLEYKNNFYKIFNSLGAIYSELQGDQVSFDRFRDILDAFTNNHQNDNYNITFYFEHFFTPINDFFLDYFGADKPRAGALTAAAVASRDGKQMYQHIKVENQQLRKELSRISKEFTNRYWT